MLFLRLNPDDSGFYAASKDMAQTCLCDLNTNCWVNSLSFDRSVEKVLPACSHVNVYIIRSEHLLSATLLPTFHNFVVL